MHHHSDASSSNDWTIHPPKLVSNHVHHPIHVGIVIINSIEMEQLISVFTFPSHTFLVFVVQTTDAVAIDRCGWASCHMSTQQVGYQEKRDCHNPCCLCSLCQALYPLQVLLLMLDCHIWQSTSQRPHHPMRQCMLLAQCCKELHLIKEVVHLDHCPLIWQASGKQKKTILLLKRGAALG